MNDLSLTEDEWSHLLSFKGYGRVDAPVWFVGIEEGGDSSVEFLKHRAAVHGEVEDLADAHRRMGMDINKSPTGTWWIMSRMMLYARGESDWSQNAVARAYRNELLGGHCGETLLTELLPIPSKDVGTWLHAERYPSKQEYREAVLEERLSMLRAMLDTGRPRFVICYGKTYWTTFRRLFGEARFSSVESLDTEVAVVGDTTIALTWFFSPQYIPINAIPDLCEAIGLSAGSLAARPSGVDGT